MFFGTRKARTLHNVGAAVNVADQAEKYDVGTVAVSRNEVVDVYLQTKGTNIST